MSDTNSFWNHPIDKIEEALSIRKQMSALQAKLDSIFGGSSAPKTAAKSAPGKQSPAAKTRAQPGPKPQNGKRTISAASRAKMAAAQRARWEEKRKAATGNAADAPSASTSKKTRKKRSGITPDGRAKLAAAMKARWAAKRNSAPAE